MILSSLCVRKAFFIFRIILTNSMSFSILLSDKVNQHTVGG